MSLFNCSFVGVEIVEENEDCKLSTEAYKVEFVSKKFFKKGLPYTGKVG